jgi:choline dehydrogenase-like flavoprotein
VRDEIASSAPIVHGRDLGRGFRHGCEAVVVGSGAGGAVVATLLAEAGLDVVLLEEGAYHRPEDVQRFAPSETLRRVFREAGMFTALPIGPTPLVSLTLGRAVGGSSLITGGVCFRIPSDVHARWERELGLAELTERAFEPAYADVERRLAVREVPEALRSASTRAYVTGAERLGITVQPLRRNTGDDCEGNGRCNFGCPAGAKRSVDVAYLRDAVRHGARMVSDALVERVVTRDGAAVGVEGRLLGGRWGAPRHRFRVEARAVVLACGTVHTPPLLQRLGVRSEHLGRHITLHPAARMVARFRDRLNGWDGALQSVYSDDFHEQGIKLVGVYSAVNVLAAGLPGVGPTLLGRVRDMPHLGVFGGMVHDEGGGVVRPSALGREPLLTYAMAPRDLARLRKAIALLAEMALAGDAEEVFPPVFGAEPIRTVAQARALAEMPLDARRIECMAFHPLGSARVANDPRRGVVDQRGECFEVRRLHVADGSLLPTSIGVNSQVAIMAAATRVAWHLRDRLVAERARRAGSGPFLARPC